MYSVMECSKLLFHNFMQFHRDVTCYLSLSVWPVKLQAQEIVDFQHFDKPL